MSAQPAAVEAVDEAAERAIPAIELKGTTVSVISVFIGGGPIDRIRAALEAKLGAKNFFDGEAAVLDFSRVPVGSDLPDLAKLVELVRGYRLKPVAVRGLPEALHEAAETLNLAAIAPAPMARAPLAAVTITAPPEESPPAPSPPPSPTLSAPVAEAPATVTALVIDRPLRSGQRVYAKGRDLVVHAPVNPGAELIADGSVHCYGRLRGRVLAGASGDVTATIVAANFEAELVSIAGVYKTFETVPADAAGKLIIVRLRGEGGTPRIVLEPIPTT